MIAIQFLAAAIPGLFWEQGPETKAAILEAGVDCIRVPATTVEAWKAAGVCATAADPASLVKLPAPGVQFRPNIATASTAPWVDTNGWRLQRLAGKPVYYEAGKGKAALSAAEAFMFGADALIRVLPDDLKSMAEMLAYLKKAGVVSLPALVNIGLVDDGSAIAGEAMNLLTRRNLLFRIVKQPDPKLDLNVQPGAKDANPAEFAARVRQKLTDAKRLVRVYGSETVIVRLEGDGRRARVHLLNYGRDRLEGLRVRVRGNYRKVEMLGAEALDVVAGGGAIEFSVPALAVYAVADLQ